MKKFIIYNFSSHRLFTCFFNNLFDHKKTHVICTIGPMTIRFYDIDQLFGKSSIGDREPINIWTRLEDEKEEENNMDVKNIDDQFI